MLPSKEITRKSYVRPYTVLLILCFTGEFISFIVYGMILFPAGNLMVKAIWCFTSGISCAAIGGMFLNIFVVNRYYGLPAMILTFIIGILTVEFISVICLYIDLMLHYFGGDKSPIAFLAKDFSDGVIGSIITGFLLFTDKGNRILDSLKL